MAQASLATLNSADAIEEIKSILQRINDDATRGGFHIDSTTGGVPDAHLAGGEVCDHWAAGGRLGHLLTAPMDMIADFHGLIVRGGIDTVLCARNADYLTRQ